VAMAQPDPVEPRLHLLGVASVQDEYLTVADVAELLQLNQQTVRNWITRGELSAIRVGPRRVRVRRADLEEFLVSRGRAAETHPTIGAAKLSPSRLVASSCRRSRTRNELSPRERSGNSVTRSQTSPSLLKLSRTRSSSRLTNGTEIRAIDREPAPLGCLEGRPAISHRSGSWSTTRMIACSATFAVAS
jgi:excisionase family DNA binding protein